MSNYLLLGKSPYKSKKHVSKKVQFSDNLSIEYPRYKSYPISPSIYVMDETQLAVDVNPGSNV